MSKLKTIVPPPELCEAIPEGGFADSALIGTYSDGKWIVLPRCKELEALPHAPAPTLQEIMVAIHELDFIRPTCYYKGNGWEVDCNDPSPEIPHLFYAEDQDSAATAALKLWLELEKVDHE